MKKKELFWLTVIFASLIFDEVSSLANENICKPISARNSSIDDVPSIHDALAICGNGGTIIISANETFTIRSPLDFHNFNACDFQIEGTLKLSDDDLHFWENKIAFLLVNVSRSSFHSLTGSGLIDGSGQKFWDYYAMNSSYKKPNLIHLKNASHVIFTNLKLKNSPSFFIYIRNNSTNITISELIINATSTSRHEPINTDGIDTADCFHVKITNVQITNGDDCVCFKNGSNNIFVNNVSCIVSRGISVGSLGGDLGIDIVKNIYVSNVKIVNSTEGALIKVYPGGPTRGTVFVSNITFENVTIDNCHFGFRVQNCYESPNETCQANPSAALLSNITLIHFTGVTSNKYDPDVANIDCPPHGTCHLTFKRWNVISPSRNKTVLCANYDNPIGVTCTPGAFG